MRATKICKIKVVAGKKAVLRAVAHVPLSTYMPGHVHHGGLLRDER